MKKAEDTIMNDDLKLCHSLIGKYSLSEIKDVVDEECLAQAEITWDIAKQLGRREVMEWVEENRLYWKSISTTKHDYYIPICLADTWQAQKKDWGIE